MQAIKSAFAWIVADARQAVKLVSVRASAIATTVGGLMLANQNFLLSAIDRVAGQEARNTLVGLTMFLIFLVPALKCEFAPVPQAKQPDGGQGAPDAGQ